MWPTVKQVAIEAAKVAHGAALPELQHDDEPLSSPRSQRQDSHRGRGRSEPRVQLAAQLFTHKARKRGVVQTFFAMHVGADLFCIVAISKQPHVRSPMPSASLQDDKMGSTCTSPTSTPRGGPAGDDGEKADAMLHLESAGQRSKDRTHQRVVQFISQFVRLLRDESPLFELLQPQTFSMSFRDYEASCV